MKLKVKHKLMLSFGVVCLLTGLLAAFQMMRFADGMKVMMGIATYDIQVSEAVREIEVTESNLRSYREAATHAAALAQIQGGVPDITQLRRRYHDGSAVMFEQINKLKRIAGERAEEGTTEDRRRIWGELVAQINSFDQHSRRMLEEANTLMERVAAGTEPEALARLTRVEEMRVAMAGQLASLHSDISRLSEAGRQNIRNLYDDAVRSSILALIIVVALAVAIAILIGSSVTKRLGTAIGYVTQVGKGDLTKTVVVPGDDELAELGTHLNEMTGNLRSMARTTRATAESMHAATAQIRASTQQQAASVAQQLAAVEETTATLSEITESGAQINRRAQDVAQNAQVAASNSETGPEGGGGHQPGDGRHPRAGGGRRREHRHPVGAHPGDRRDHPDRQRHRRALPPAGPERRHRGRRRRGARPHLRRGGERDQEPRRPVEGGHRPGPFQPQRDPARHQRLGHADGGGGEARRRRQAPDRRHPVDHPRPRRERAGERARLPADRRRHQPAADRPGAGDPGAPEHPRGEQPDRRRHPPARRGRHQPQRSRPGSGRGRAELPRVTMATARGGMGRDGGTDKDERKVPAA
ncbi:exported protein of unknown function (plasmid) [Azospirillum baldaniorum]|uniref:HAMP domain-containing protein n=1 Tax=Azospirillum baldaniorum TaxID=1064539 RepID=A0A9P1JVC3_9PROT|nr:exported protein of unknown function [Azospirillum baldaniorum]